MKFAALLIALCLTGHLAFAKQESPPCTLERASEFAKDQIAQVVASAAASGAIVDPVREDGEGFYFLFKLQNPAISPGNNRVEGASYSGFIEVEKATINGNLSTLMNWGDGNSEIFLPKDLRN